MNELVPAKRAADWRQMKARVLDSVSSPITRRVYNLGLDEFFEWFGREPRSDTAGALRRLRRGRTSVQAWRGTDLEELDIAEAAKKYAPGKKFPADKGASRI